MPPVEFNDENKSSVLQNRLQSNQQASGLVRWLMNAGLAKTAGAANAILLSVAIAALVVTGILIYKINGGGSGGVSEAERKAMMEAMSRQMQAAQQNQSQQE